MSTSWTERAACREPGIDPELFFPVSESGPAVGQIAAARAICARCPVAADCRAWALRTGEPTGIWGGTTPGERRLLRHAQHRDADAWPHAALPR
jgi:WhiB family transcriptional regulator, redox-sensing transcriptional regulator